MKRRTFSQFAVAAAIQAPVGAQAQQKAMSVIGVLTSGSPGSFSAPYEAAFRRGLADEGFVEGRNVSLLYRYAYGRYDELPALAADLRDQGVDAIVLNGIPEARAARGVTTTIPMIYTGGGDLVAAGLIESLARPGGNITGIAILNVELTAKRLELLSEMVPTARTMAMLVNPNNPITPRMVGDAKRAAEARQLHLDVLPVTSEGEIDATFARPRAERPAPLLVGTDPFVASRREQIVRLATLHKMPAIFGFTVDGALVSYGPSIAAAYERTAVYVGRILKGARPANLPIDQATTVEFVVNLGVARTLGIVVPPALLARASQIIE